jgi:hypothetical protein
MVSRLPVFMICPHRPNVFAGGEFSGIHRSALCVTAHTAHCHLICVKRRQTAGQFDDGDGIT